MLIAMLLMFIVVLIYFTYYLALQFKTTTEDPQIVLLAIITWLCMLFGILYILLYRMLE